MECVMRNGYVFLIVLGILLGTVSTMNIPAADGLIYGINKVQSGFAASDPLNKTQTQQQLQADNTYCSPDGSLVFDTLKFDDTPNQPLTRDCIIITNGENYLKVYLDHVLFYSSNSLALAMPPPFNFFLEPQSSYAGQMINGTFLDYYSAF